MAEESNVTPSTETTTPPPAQPLGNSETTRNPDGSLKDQQTPTTPAEQKPESQNSKASTPAEAKDGDKKPAPQGAPEKYADFKAPEGHEIDAKALEVATPLFKELNLSQDQAQKLVDMYAAVSKDAAEAPVKFYEKTRADWRTEIAKSDLGNGIDNLSDEVRGVVGRAIDSMAPKTAEGFKAALDLTGVGDNPAFIRGFYELAKQLGEGTQVGGRNPSPLGQTNGAKPRSAASVMFPNLPSANG